MFRAKTINTKKVVKGAYCPIEGQHFIIVEDAEYIWQEDAYRINGMVEIIPQTLAMKTFMTDKNDKPIFGSFPVEGKRSDGGDRVKWSWSRSHRNLDGVIEWDTDRLRWIITNTYFDHNREVSLSNYVVEVIGQGGKQ